MARKNPFASLMDTPLPENTDRPSSYAPKGASKNMLGAIEELALQADRLLEGAAVVEMDADLIDGSFVQDRLEDDDAGAYAELRDAIRDRGQDSPILVRPHPRSPGRYMIVFGHRRFRVAKELGRRVKAVVKDLRDIDHVLAQGQENSARADLSYVEKAIYAGNLAALQLDEDNAFICKALSVDASALSVMLSIAGLPKSLLEAVGPARKIGRPRWLALRKLLDRPANLEMAKAVVEEESFSARPSDERFLTLMARVQASNTKRSKPKSEPIRRSWKHAEQNVAAELVADDRKFSLALKGDTEESRAFGDFVIDRLDTLYDDFRKEKGSTNDGA